MLRVVAGTIFRTYNTLIFPTKILVANSVLEFSSGQKSGLKKITIYNGDDALK